MHLIGQLRAWPPGDCVSALDREKRVGRAVVASSLRLGTRVRLPAELPASIVLLHGAQLLAILMKATSETRLRFTQDRRHFGRHLLARNPCAAVGSNILKYLRSLCHATRLKSTMLQFSEVPLPTWLRLRLLQSNA